ncbi:hypothetical protein CRM22_010363 [Opisthorchis felineus]|uniref:Serine/arginine repetitive matrix protein 2 n=1 Tax=Opisthorchis felineus TaxID=147828 RepID=A0A4S2KZJ8_OPIFE|nr:hypothetical protein CRM22_010363 [Opisthorchis felineus]
MTDIDTGAYDQLDFEDDDDALAHHAKDAQESQAVPRTRALVGSKEKWDSFKDLRTSDFEESMEDDGELKSEDESDLNASHSSEEGEVLSEFEEVEVTVEQSPPKEETPWERGVRLARERLQKVKILKATEKDLAEKRMTLEVPTSAVNEESDLASKEEILWPCYYQVAIVGRTELTGLRFLPEDLQPPTATEIAEWRLGLSDGRRDRQRQRRRRDRRSHTGSSSASSSSGTSSRSSSTDSISVASSLASVAASWKATCAQAMKDYLSSPIRNKDRRGGRGHGARHSRSLSSESNSQSSDSRSASDRSGGRAGRRGYRATHGAAGGSELSGRDNRRYWTEAKHASRPSLSGSERSSKSRSGSHSSGASRQNRHSRAWNYGNHREQADEDWQGSPNHSGSPSSPVRRRSDVPPLPHERPVKRPWVAAPSLATGLVSSKTGKATRRRSGDQTGSSSRSGSRSSQAGEERQFITSWSRSPSSGTEGRLAREAVRRERLPDVVPGSHATRLRRAASPSIRRRKSRSPFAEDKGGAAQGDSERHVPESAAVYDELSVPRRTQIQQYEESVAYAVQHAASTQHQRQEIEHDTIVETNNQPPPTVGELPSASSRPGVKITLAPRLKSSAVDMTNLAGGVTRPSGSRTNQPSPPPRLPRLPFPIPISNRGNSPNSAGPTETPTVIDQEEIRRQAEAAAAIVEARERRRAAAEAARRRRNPKKKRDDLSKIPIRGRPTYRRRSFTDSSLESGSSRSSRSASRSTSTPRSVSPASSRAVEQQIIQQNTEFPSQRHRGSRKKYRAEVPPVPGIYGESEEMVVHRVRHAPRGMPSEFKPPRDEISERHQHRSKANHGGAQRLRGERIMESELPYKSNTSVQMKGLYMDYDFGNNPAYPHGVARHRVSKSGMMNVARQRNANDEFIQTYQDTSRGMVRRSGAALPQPMERITRPRTPHADMGSEDFNIRPTHTTGLLRLGKHERKRNEEREFDDAPVRKRAMIAEPVVEPVTNLELRRARSRHRSRGPGGQIDRSEPFESDAGSFAAEQRLRELRERLNFVDGAIAELRAGSNAGFSDLRR